MKALEIIREKREAFRNAQKNKLETTLAMLEAEKEERQKEIELQEKIITLQEEINQQKQQEQQTNKISFQTRHPTLSKISEALMQHHQEMKEETPKLFPEKKEKVKMF